MLKKFLIAIIITVSLATISSNIVLIVHSQDSVDDLEQELEKTQQEKEYKQQILEKTQSEIESILNSSLTLSQKISAIEEQIQEMEQNIADTQADIQNKEEQIRYHEDLITERIDQVQAISRRLYINSKVNMFDVFLSEDTGSSMLRSYILKKYTLEKQRQNIEELNVQLGDMQVKRDALEQQRIKLEAEGEALDESKAILSSEQAKLEREIAARTAAKGQLQNEIGLLNSKITELQEAILLARSGAYVPSVGSLPTGGDYYSTAAGFRESAPAGSFAVFSFGAYTHRKGMSQYGALARAESGQNYQQILQAYYGKTPVLKDTSGKIKVAGQGSVDFESYYLYGIAEMPSSWSLEAQKAQAVAARTYAYRYYRDNIEICVTEACQVFYKPKADAPPALWKQAVDETRGMVLEDVVTFYSSTAGGYLDTSGWDTTDRTGGGDWTARAYESIAGSPWFYKAWYRSGYSDSSSSCGRYPWMTQEEMADILNTWLVMNREGVTGSVDDGRILPVTVNTCTYSGFSGNPYSMSEMRSLLSAPVTSIIGYPGVSLGSSGQTDLISFSTNRGVVSLSGADFKAVFNTRAPGYLAVPQSGFALLNIERK